MDRLVEVSITIVLVGSASVHPVSAALYSSIITFASDSLILHPLFL